MQRRWVQWLLIWLAIILLGLGLRWILHLQGARTVAEIVQVLTSAGSFLWLCWGLWCGRDRRWIRVVAWMIGGAWALILLYLLTGMSGYTIAALGTWLAAVVFFVGLWLIRRVLSPGFAVLGVARTLVDEAIRMKIALIFIVLLVMVVPVLFVVMDAEQRLEYRIQMFLTWSLTTTSLLLSLMTIFLACGTICSEVTQRQIFLTLSKPVSRAGYLLGKWVGIVLINALLLSVSGGGIYVFAKLLQHQPARDGHDRRAVEERVMAARVSTAPKPVSAKDMAEQIEARRAQLEKQDPVRFAPGKVSLKDGQEIVQAVVRKWYTIAPMGEGRYLFDGLERASHYGQAVQLRFKPQGSRSSPDGNVRLAFLLNGRPWPMTSDGLHIQQPVSDGDFHVIDLPVWAIEEGKLEVVIANVNLVEPRATWPASITFPPKDGLEVLYQVGSFEPNLVRTLLILYIRLAFLAVLGLMAGTFLGFPVACLMCLLVYTIASASGFLSEALSYYAVSPAEDVSTWKMITSFIGHWIATLGSGEIWTAIKMLIKLVGQSVVTLVPSFSEFDPVPLVSDGRLVPYRMIGSAVLKVGILWTGICAMIGVLVFRSRELARVTV